ncbi:hypothetical protein BDN72DRAFT_883040 [Pluteus cervinus]|uniref:Uncharacterized protein n=1 Tax=Pluteus cervinus TaxID=181527 RepID=A0ACD3A734_9AGAR|nr:hypothetical protein BDN72DRAFT_883040 [Pluteus cervinus]
MPDSRLIVPESLTELEREDIVKYLRNESRGPGQITSISSGSPLDEASTQFFSTLSPKRTARLLAFLQYAAPSAGKGYYFFVMEKIDMPTLATYDIPEAEAVQYVASAVRWLLDQMPRDFTRVWHQFFKDHEALVAFVSSEAISKFVNEAHSRRPGKETRTTISLSDDLAIYHSGIRKHNFLNDVSNVMTRRICVIDFQPIGVLPKPFQTLDFFSIDRSFAAGVGNYLGYRPSDISNVLMKASAMLQRIRGNTRLGLNELGERPSTK